MMKGLKKICILLLAACLFVACTCRDDETLAANAKTPLYAIVKPEGAKLTDITPEDYVLTLDNFVSVKPETGEFKVTNTERIDSKAYPLPTQNVIQFYSKGKFLFEAKLNSVLSSYLPTGLTFCHFLSDKNGVARYDLHTVTLSHDGKVGEGSPTEQQQQGLKRLYQILKKAGKTSKNIEYDFEFGFQIE